MLSWQCGAYSVGQSQELLRKALVDARRSTVMNYKTSVLASGNGLFTLD